MAIAVGIVIALILGQAGQVGGGTWDAILIGILAGVAAAGAWSLPKAVTAADHPPD